MVLFGGQFEPNFGGQFKPKLVVNLLWKLVVNLTVFSRYVIYFGKSPDKLYGSIMVYGKTEYYFNGLDKSDVYYFQIEAFNSNGIGVKSEIKKSIIAGILY